MYICLEETNKPIKDDILTRRPPINFDLNKIPIIAETAINPKTYLVNMHIGHACKYINLSKMIANKIIEEADTATATS